MQENPFLETPTTETKSESWIVDILQSFVFAVFIFIIIYLFIATPNQVTGISMQPNFHDSELVLTNKITQWFGATDFGRGLGLDYQRGDVVVFQKPGMGRDLIKRVIALPGEKVALKDGNFYVNGRKLNEDYIPPEVRTNQGTYLREGEEIQIQADSYFLVGDNRNNSLDSRFVEVGQISREWMKGKVILRYLPIDVFGVIGTGSYELNQ